ncbi:urease accessory protein UreF [Methylotenera sp. 73s]|nr:urease accessory UreF family protein [Methylotenera sp. 73s]
MLNNHLGLMLSLQHSDSFFPSGATAFSWGLESLNRDKIISDTKSVSHYIETQLLHRWVSFDQAIISAAWYASQTIEHRSNSNLMKIFEIDAFAEAMTLSESVRTGSRRLGQTLMTVHVKLGTPSAIKLHAHIVANANTHYPHLAVTQGYLWAKLGVSELESRAISAHTLCTSATSAALRLGLIGHIDAQRILMHMHTQIVKALDLPAPALSNISSSTLAVDIGNLRHEALDARMFAN